MKLLLFILSIFFVSKWLIEKAILSLFKETDEATEKEEKTVINNLYQENHLHISKEDFEKLKK